VKPLPVTVTMSPTPTASLAGSMLVTNSSERRWVAPSTIC
jgi:hypothetical protein